MANGTGGYVYNSYNEYPNDDVHCWRLDRNAVANVDKTALFVNGVKKTPTNTTNGGTAVSGGTFSASNAYLCGPTSYGQYNVHTLVIYGGATAMSDADIAAISAIIAALP